MWLPDTLTPEQNARDVGTALLARVYALILSWHPPCASELDAQDPPPTDEIAATEGEAAR